MRVNGHTTGECAGRWKGEGSTDKEEKKTEKEKTPQRINMAGTDVRGNLFIRSVFQAPIIIAQEPAK